MKTLLLSLPLCGLLAVAGCATSQHNGFPKGARVVGGGLQIEWQPPSDGTAVLVELTTGKTVFTHSVGEFKGGVSFDASLALDEQLISAVFPQGLPEDARFVLYFVPADKGR